MKLAPAVLSAAIALTSASSISAQETKSLAPLRKDLLGPTGKVELYKDPWVATYLSATLPGLGQFYSGKKARGLFFLASVVGAFGSAYAFYEPAELELSDYDKLGFGGNGDGVLNTSEIESWQDKEYQGDAFDRLSTTRKVGAVSSAVVGLGLYIWNVVDAGKQARAHNRHLAQQRVSLGLQAGPDNAGLAVRLRF